MSEVVARTSRAPALALALAAALCGCDGGGARSGPGATTGTGEATGATGAATAAATGTAAAGVAGPEERWTEIASDAAPLLMNPVEKMPPPDFIHRGELVRVGASAGESSWDGELLGVPSKREGALFRARRTAAGSETFAFQPDLGGEVPVSSSSGLCDALARRAPFELSTCKESLQRARTADGAVVSFVRCGTGVCPVALERDGKLGAIGLTNLASTFFVTGKKRSVLVGVTRFSEADGKRSGGKVAVIALDGAEPVKVAEHAADEIDARDASRALQKIVSVTVTRGEIRLRGSRDERAADGTLLRSQAIDERLPMPALD